jgi:nitroimidazol reductase NimA-like FMN-containing flavoprotein (pyridoxamine 5'-phosphate oxidase superfamily)
MKPVPLERRGDFVVTMFELDADVCLRLLTGSHFGRLGFDDDGPTVLPVNAAFADGAVLFRTGVGSVLDRKVVGHTVAFETDEIDPVGESGWSVLVRGVAHRVTDRERLASLADAAIHPWAPGRRDVWVEIRPQSISGRMIKRHRLGRGTTEPQLPPD